MMSVQYKKILVPVDGSKNSERALSHAVSLANSFCAEICILYVSVLSQRTPLYEQVKGSKIPPNPSKEPEDFAEKIIDESLKLVPENIRVQTHNELGDPRVVIAEFAEQKGYDIIVMGNRGLGTISGLIMGSVSSYIVRTSKCPVLIVK